MRVLTTLLVLGLVLAGPARLALADSPTPTPTPTPPPRPSPSATPSPGASPSASASASPSPTPTPAVIGDELTRAGGAPIEEMRHVIAATSLAERIDAERTLAAAERELLIARREKLRSDGVAAASVRRGPRAPPGGAAVVAAARGRVAFVGHIAGGAEVVILAHADGLITLYAHLDDTVAPPPVRVGDVVEAGQRIGSIGLTGVTTGAHLHFAVRRGNEPLDPRSILPTDRPS